jgi:hypothetical protein
LRQFGSNLNRLRDDVKAAIEKQNGKNTITLTDALDLIRKYQLYHAYRKIMPLSEALIILRTMQSVVAILLNRKSEFDRAGKHA